MPVHRDIRKFYRRLATMYTHLHNNNIASHIRQARWVLGRLNDVLTDMRPLDSFYTMHWANTMRTT